MNLKKISSAEASKEKGYIKVVGANSLNLDNGYYINKFKQNDIVIILGMRGLNNSKL